MKYAGRVYDGPWEGRQLANDNPWYFFHLVDPESIVYARPGGIIPTVSTGFGYRWSHPLRAWVFCGRT